MAVCAVCGQENPDIARFCLACGSPLAEEAALPPEAELNDEDEWFDLHIRTAVHTGEALVVPAARATEGEGMAAGDVMNTAARLQSKAPEDGVVVGEATYRATAELFEYLESEPVEAK